MPSARFAEQVDFFQANRAIIKLAVMEHAANTINDFLPGVRRILDKNNHFTPYMMTLGCMCDAFRMQLNTAIMQDIRANAAQLYDPGFMKNTVLDAFTALSATAQSSFDRCTRAYRCSAPLAYPEAQQGVPQALSICFANSPAAAAPLHVDTLADPADRVSTRDSAKSRGSTNRRGNRTSTTSSMAISLNPTHNADSVPRRWVFEPLVSEQSPFRNIFNMYVCNNRFVFRFINSQIFSVEQADACWPVISNIQVFTALHPHALPQLALPLPPPMLPAESGL